jgi:hypothetical protein
VGHILTKTNDILILKKNIQNCEMTNKWQLKKEPLRLALQTGQVDHRPAVQVAMHETLKMT